MPLPLQFRRTSSWPCCVADGNHGQERALVSDRRPWRGRGVAVLAQEFVVSPVMVVGQADERDAQANHHARNQNHLVENDRRIELLEGDMEGGSAIFGALYPARIALADAHCGEAQ